MNRKLNNIKKLIKLAPVVVFSKTHCPYCKMAKGLLSEQQQKYVAIELDKRNDSEELLGVLGSITGSKTVPRIFVKGECIGGFSDLKDLHDSGEWDNYFD